MSSSQLAVLQAVTTWREGQARARDKPRGRILKDSSCYDIARVQPGDLKSLSRISDISSKTLHRSADELLQIIKQTQALDENDLPATLPKPLPPETGSILKRLKNHVQARAEHLQVAEELLAKKRDYEALLRSGVDDGRYHLPETLCGWRKAVVGDDLLSLLQREA
ncbi:HRDC domain-containing protein [Oceanicoccus sp. KOV_DT_Chl]|uniref:HRDC domain-containing protein n=1 Tax=Oceanicoccus sp. KOV_DT_Chl TaxID=1904639 RepID=UPI001F1B3A35|nr:HRDC domain-containing protein [Oceanicoccus sp. KOV_DT_Chl]